MLFGGLLIAPPRRLINAKPEDIERCQLGASSLKYLRSIWELLAELGPRLDNDKRDYAYDGKLVGAND